MRYTGASALHLYSTNPKIMSDVLLENRDYTVIVAKTLPTLGHNPPGYEQRWIDAHDAIVSLAQKCEELDPDGITIYISSKDYPQGCFRRYDKVTPSQLTAVFDDNYPPEVLDLLSGLQIALDDFLFRKAAQQTKPNGEIIVVLIDGEPCDRLAIIKTIVDAAAKLDSDNELGIGFAQIGDDVIARGFLNALDADLRSTAGAKFDIVHTRILEDIKPECLTNFLMDIVRK
jgi:hypothetical protein